MSTRIIFVATSLLFTGLIPATAKAQVIQDDAVIGPLFGVEPVFHLEKTVQPGNSLFGIEITNPAPGRFTFSAFTIAEPIAFFPVEFGELIDENFRDNGRVFLSNGDRGSDVPTFSLDFDPLESHYVGYWDDLGLPFDVINATDNFGWARLTFDGTDLTVSESATAVGRGIFAGTLTTIPEPSGMLLLAASFCSTALRRQR